MSDAATITPELKSDSVDEAKPAIRPKRRVSPTNKPDSKPKQQPPHSVVLHNDPINRFVWVVGVLQKTLGCGREKAFLITLKTHCCGRGVAWIGSLEVAEFKAQQLVAAGPDPLKAAYGARSLKVTVEPLP